MSKDGSVKATPGCKHKERKPKKPHYIPRPWGKPYNYKCFQCPFTCMEKSHLYNHMKYSLCKNSLSLLIESEWPYKRGAAPHAHGLLPAQGGGGPSEQQRRGRRGDGGEERESRAAGEQENEEEEEKGCEEGSEEGAGRAREPPGGAAVAMAAPPGKHKPPPPAERPAPDAPSLEEQLLQQYALPGPLLAEQWRRLAKHPPPPPPPTLDYQDPSALSLSLLGMGYPLGPLGPLGPAGLFSYVSSAAAQSHAKSHAQSLAQLGPLPFLVPPQAERALPPRLYYPYLCERTLGADATKPSSGGVEASGPPPPPGCYPAKLGLWKVPALRPRPPDPGWGLKRKTGSPAPGGREGPPEKRPAGVGFTLDLLKSLQSTSPLAMATEKMLLSGSVPGTQLPVRPEPWSAEAPCSPGSDPSLPSQGPGSGAPRGGAGEGPLEPVSALLSHLSRALQEYQEAECRMSRLGKGEAPARGRLWDHLSRIRSELFHLHQALERTARPPEGPLDLSVKREGAGETVARRDQRETEEEEEEEEEEEGVHEEEKVDEEEEEEDEEERERKALRESLESRKQSLDLLIRMSQAGVAPVSGEALGLRPSPAEAPWPGRTTKCEADSSVLLCPDGRPVVFAELPSAAKTPKRPPSTQPPSPLMPADS